MSGINSMLATALGCVLLEAVAIAQDTSAQNATFSQCAACHSVDGTKGTGPTLKGIMGRTSGSVPGFRYSRA